MNVRWTEAALSDLSAIEAYLTRQHSRSARDKIDRMFTRTQDLADQPYFGAMVPEYDDESLREVFEDPYRILYRVLDTQIDVVAVVHGAKRLPRGL